MPINFTPEERYKLLNALGQGRKFAISAKALARTLGYPVGGNQVKLRGLIKKCIEIDGDLIGAATGKPAGFFIISTIQELETYLNSLENRTRSDNDRRTALISSWNRQVFTHTSRQILNIK